MSLFGIKTKKEIEREEAVNQLINEAGMLPKEVIEQLKR
jgi:hypothetical protein